MKEALNYIILLLFPITFAIIAWFIKRIISDFDKKHANHSNALKSIRQDINQELSNIQLIIKKHQILVDDQRSGLVNYSQKNKNEMLTSINTLKTLKSEIKVLSESFLVKLKTLDFSLTKAVVTTKENKLSLTHLHGKILSVEQDENKTKKIVEGNRTLLKRHNDVIVDIKNKVELKNKLDKLKHRGKK